ncbi:ROK family transcriptional regulator [Aquibacillus sediminis]|uniref:ROK family transcriptional regulator n=1 Tax=Aquibacillus sediminis TaxID=2574734 RepID=UPI001486E196|nr:ROK family transcriptional regulator [Aquibacillus sediminis]
MNTGDASYIKKLNRKILIEELIKNKSLSRSKLARITGLNKATVSAQVSDLLHEQIVVETNEGASVTRGRKPILLEINGDAGYSIGIDIDEIHMNIIFTNLQGKPFYRINLSINDISLDHVADFLVEVLSPVIDQFNQSYHPIGLVGVGVGIHGIVNNKNEVVFTPNQKWSTINISERLEAAFHTVVSTDNNANLCVFAEHVYEEPLADLFSITLYSGIGLGIVNDNKIYRGFKGFAGEIGHMIVKSNGDRCPCGNRGCWELYASERSFTNELKTRFPSLPLPEGIDAMVNDSTFKAILDDYLHYLAIGLNNIINIFNPEKIILNGEILNGHLPYIDEIQNKLTSKINNYQEIRASYLGADACALGGAALALKNFYDVDMINFVEYNYALR